MGSICTIKKEYVAEVKNISLFSDEKIEEIRQSKMLEIESQSKLNTKISFKNPEVTRTNPVSHDMNIDGSEDKKKSITIVNNHQNTISFKEDASKIKPYEIKLDNFMKLHTKIEKMRKKSKVF